MRMITLQRAVEIEKQLRLLRGEVDDLNRRVNNEVMARQEEADDLSRRYGDLANRFDDLRSEVRGVERPETMEVHESDCSENEQSGDTPASEEQAVIAANEYLEGIEAEQRIADEEGIEG